MHTKETIEQKAERVKAYLAKRPNANRAQIAQATGIGAGTIIKIGELGLAPIPAPVPNVSKTRPQIVYAKSTWPNSILKS